MILAAIRVRGKVGVRGDIADTMAMLRLRRQNHCVLLQDTDAVRGMLKKTKDYITWGEVDAEVLAKLLLKRGRARGRRRVSDAYVKANSRFKSIWDLSQAIAAGEAKLTDVDGLVPVIRLHPPQKGYEGVKRSFVNGGALGYRGGQISKLLDRMIVEGGA